MRVLGLTISISAGHRRGCEAILEAFAERGAETRMVDALALAGPRAKAAVTEAYLSIIRRRPEVWAFLYDNPRLTPIAEVVRRFFVRKDRRKYLDLLEETRPDLVVATQAIPSSLMAAIKTEEGLDLPLLACSTDYGSHPYWAAEGIDAYCVATESARRRLVRDGAAPETVHVTGIPVSRAVAEASADLRAARRRAEAEWGFAPDERVVLLVGGGLGLGVEPVHLARIEAALASSGGGAAVALAGSSIDLAERFRALPCRPGVRRLVAGVVPDVASLYARADVVVTKPGGLTLAETLALGRPLVLVAPLPGQEVQNLTVLENAGAALTARTPGSLERTVARLLSDPAEAARQAARARAAGRPHAASHIAKIGTGTIFSGATRGLSKN